MKKSGYLIAALLLFFRAEAAASIEDTARYTVQAASSVSRENIIRAAHRLEDSGKDEVRVEKIGAHYVLRIGRYERKKEGRSCLSRVRRRYRRAFLRRAFDIPGRIVYASTAPIELPESAGPADTALAASKAEQQVAVPERETVPEGEPAAAVSEKGPVFRGVVHDSRGRPVAGAIVEILGVPLAPVRTGPDGSFIVFGLSPGKVFSLKISKAGYETLRAPVREIPSRVQEEPERYMMRRPSASRPPSVIPDTASSQLLPQLPAEPPAPSSGSPPSPTAESTSSVSESPSGDEITITADTISYDRDTDTYDAKGNVIVTYSGGTLMADSVILNKGTDDAVAEGEVVVTSGKDILEGERAVFNIATKMGIAYQGKMYLSQNHFYLKGTKIEKKGERTYHVVDAVATTCDGDSPDWRLTGKTLDVTIDGYGTMKDAKMLAKNVPVLYTPYLLFPAKTTRQSGFLYPHISYSANKDGWDVEVPFYWAISDDSDATFYQRYMDVRGFKEGVEYRYFLGKNSYGTFYGDFLNDNRHVTETAGNISRDWQSDQQRWSLYLNHQTDFSPTSYLRADIMEVSDPWYFRDFSSYNYYLNNYTQQEQQFRKITFLGDQSLGSLDSTVRYVQNWPLYNLTGLVKYTDDLTKPSNSATLQRFPEVTFTGIRRPIMGSPYNLEFTSAYDYFYRGEGQKGHLTDVQPILSRPFNLGVYLQATPQITVRETYWSRDDNTPGGRKEGDRFLYTPSLNMSTEVHRIFNIGGKTLDKIRHGIKPEVTYTYVPFVEQGGIPDYVGQIAEQHTVTYSLTNTFIARMKDKSGGASYLEFLRLKLFQTYDIKEAKRDVVAPAADNRPFSDVNMELDFMPSGYLTFSARHAYAVNSGYWRQTNYDLTVSDKRGDAATIGYRYTKFSLEELNLSLKAMLTRSLALTYVLRRNELNHITMERTYGIRYRKQCWSTEVTYSEQAISPQATDQIFTVMFTLYGLGQVGQEIWKTTSSAVPQ